MNALYTSHVLLLLASSLALCFASVLSDDPSAADDPKGEPSKSDPKPESDERLFMLNVLWFKPDGGKEMYNRYLKAAGPFVAEYGGKSDGAYVPEAIIIGEFDADLVFFVEWPNQKAFTDFVQDPGYQAVSHLRKDAIRDSLLIRCKKTQTSGKMTRAPQN